VHDDLPARARRLREDGGEPVDGLLGLGAGDLERVLHRATERDAAGDGSRGEEQPGDEHGNGPAVGEAPEPGEEDGHEVP